MRAGIADDELTDAWDFAADTVTEAITLYAKWEEATTTVGDLGPAGGYIFYDDEVGFDWDDSGTIESDEKDLLDGTNDGTVSGDRYLEAAPNGWVNDGDDPLMVWGAYNVYIPDIKGPDVGDGETNTSQIVTTAGDDALAAKACSDYSVTVGDTTYDDWFLPSRDELYLMYQNLQLQSKGGFSPSNYWSSSEKFATVAYVQNFDSTGFRGDNTKSIGYSVRPVRAY